MAESKARKWVRSLGLSGKDARRIERAFCTLADFEGPIKDVGAQYCEINFDHAHANVCEALRKIADAWAFDQLDV